MFIDFEGIDGSGKTTLSNALADRLEARGLKVTHARAGGELRSGHAWPPRSALPRSPASSPCTSTGRDGRLPRAPPPRRTTR